MIKHGTSHGLAYLVCTISAGLLIGLLGHYLPGAIEWLKDLSRTIIDRFDITVFDSEQLSILLLAAAFVSFPVKRTVHK